jgi:hypothetical protein
MKKRMNKLTLKAVLLGMIVVSIFVLVVYNVKDLLFGTPFAVSTANDGMTIGETFVPIEGVAQHARELSINGRPVAIDRNGAFTDGVILSPGYNIIEVVMRDRFGKAKTKIYHWVAEPTASLARSPGDTYQQ